MIPGTRVIGVCLTKPSNYSRSYSCLIGSHWYYRHCPWPLLPFMVGFNNDSDPFTPVPCGWSAHRSPSWCYPRSSPLLLWTRVTLKALPPTPSPPYTLPDPYPILGGLLVDSVSAGGIPHPVMLENSNNLIYS